MRTCYKTADEVRIFRLFKNVADGSMPPMDAAYFVIDEVNVNYRRGLFVGEHATKEKRPAEMQSA